jgi:Protein of unknown function (DUF3040)
MSLPARQQRQLRRMENALQASEPRLASLFAMFTRLNNEEPVSAESLRGRRWRAAWAGMPVYALVFIPLMFAMMIGMLFGGVAHGAATCGSQHQTSESSLIRRPACMPAAKSAFSKSAATGIASPAPATARKSCPARPVGPGVFPGPVAAAGTMPQHG